MPTVVGCRVMVVFVVFVDRLSTVRDRQKGAVDLSRPQSAGVVVAGRVKIRISHSPVLTPGQIPWGYDASLTQRFSGSLNGTTSTNSMISFLGAAAYVVVPGDVQWVRLGPYERSGGPCPGPPILCFWYFLTLIQDFFAFEKWNRRLLFFDGHGRGAGHLPPGTVPGADTAARAR